MSAGSQAPTVAIVAAMAMEIRPFLSDIYPLVASEARTFPSLKIFEGEETGGIKVMAVLSGVGRKGAEEAAKFILKNPPELVANVGFAGGLNPDFKKGSFFFPSEIRNLEGNHSACNPFKNFSGRERFDASSLLMPRFDGGTLLTTPAIVSSCEEKRKLSALGDAVDMEGYYLCSALASARIPFFCAKVISDAADEPIPLDFSPALQNGKFSSLKAFGLMLKHPAKIFPVLRLARWMEKYAFHLSALAQIFSLFSKLPREGQV